MGAVWCGDAAELAPHDVRLARGHGYDVLGLVDDVFHEAGASVLFGLSGLGTSFCLFLRRFPQFLLLLLLV